MGNMALKLAAAGRYHEAEPLYLEAWELFKEVVGETRRYALREMHSLASVWYARGEEKEALVLIRKIVELRRQLLGEKQADTMASEKMLEAWMKEPGEHDVHEIRKDEIESVTRELKDPEEPTQQEGLEEERHI